MPRYAISDIHGCAKTFKALLKQINFSKTDELFLLGDYVDRGPDSKGVIDHIWYLQKEGYTIRCLKGNHEQMMIDAGSSLQNARMWLMHGGSETSDSFNANHYTDIPTEYIRWIEALPHYLETEGYILVHAGLDFNIENPMEDQRAMLWIRKWDHVLDLDWLAGRIILHGHTPTMRTVIEKNATRLEEHPVLVIDNGCVYDRPGMGYLIAFDLDQKKLHFCPNSEFADNLS